MARIFTTVSAEASAKAFLHDLMYAGGLTQNIRVGSTPSFTQRTDSQNAAKTLCDELVNRDFSNVDSAMRMLSRYSFRNRLDGTGAWVAGKPDFIAKSIVYLANCLQLYWDDTIRTPYEIDEFKKTTLGEAVYKYNQVISAIKDKKRTSGSSGGAGTGGGGASTAPKNDYKSTGPQSGNVRDLLDPNGGQGTPGNKVFADGPYIYRIIGESTTSKNVPTVFIKPLSTSGASGNTNKIFISSGRGYTDCTCYFDNPNDAQNFLDKIIADNRVPSNVANMQIVKGKADSNGYFIVGTEYGPVAVSAKTLNEALTETFERKDRIAKGVAGWKNATKDYSDEEVEELHTWMRRD
jgi:hypothetical protein